MRQGRAGLRVVPPVIDSFKSLVRYDPQEPLVRESGARHDVALRVRLRIALSCHRSKTMAGGCQADHGQVSLFRSFVFTIADRTWLL